MRQARQEEPGKAFARQMPFDFVRLGGVLAEGGAELHLGAAARRHDLPPQSLAAGRARAGAADQRLAEQRQARHGQTQIQPGIADHDDASPRLVFPLCRHAPSFARNHPRFPVIIDGGFRRTNDEENLPWQLPLRPRALRGRHRSRGRHGPLQLLDLHQAAGLEYLGQAAGFRLLSGKDELGDYQFNTKQGHHRFCKTCGIAPFGDGDVKEIGGAYVAISVACLDDVTPEQLASLPISTWTAGTTTGSSRRRSRVISEHHSLFRHPERSRGTSSCRRSNRIGPSTAPRFARLRSG